MTNNSQFNPRQPIVFNPTTNEKFMYHGQGKDLFGIGLLNVLLSILTLGIYYPWAKASYIKYMYSQTEFMGSRFSFHGTGKEMFIGMVKAVIVLGVISAAVAGAAWMGAPWLIILIYLGAVFFLIPLVVVGSLKYRSSRSSWRGIHFGYRGSFAGMFKVYCKGIVYTTCTFGLYYCWFISNFYEEILDNLRVGDIRFGFEGRGGAIFGKFFIGYLLTILTGGIYAFKLMSDMHNYIFNNVTVTFTGTERLNGYLKSNTTGFGYFKLVGGNILLVLFTLGLGAPWAITRSLKYFTETLEVESNIPFETLTQTETSFFNASAEGFADAMDLQVI